MIQAILHKLRLRRLRLVSAVLGTLGLVQLVPPASAQEAVNALAGRAALESRVAVVRAALHPAGAAVDPAADPVDVVAQWRNWPNWGNWNNWNNWANWGNWFNR